MQLNENKNENENENDSVHDYTVTLNTLQTNGNDNTYESKVSDPNTTKNTCCYNTPVHTKTQITNHVITPSNSTDINITRL